jgi:hypothetical protein
MLAHMLYYFLHLHHPGHDFLLLTDNALHTPAQMLGDTWTTGAQFRDDIS